MRATIAVLLLAFSASLFAATGDVPLSPTLQAPLPGIAHVAIATSGMEYLAVYGVGTEIYWQRSAIDGTPLDPQAHRLEGATLAMGLRPWIEAVWTGQTYLVFWNEPGDAVVARAIDRDGILTDEFNVLTGMTLRDVARWEHEVAVLTSVNDAWRLTILNPYGARLGTFNFTSNVNDLNIVRLDDGWALAGRAAAGNGLALVSPQTGASRTVAPNVSFLEVHASPAGGALTTAADRSLGVLRRDGVFVPIVLARPLDYLSIYHAALVSPAPSGWTVFYRADGIARIASIRADGTVLSDTPLAGPFPSRDSLLYYSFAAASARDDFHFLLQPAPLGTLLGVESIAVAGSLAYVTPPYAIFDAVQQWGRTAHGPGIDLVAWLESGFNAWGIRATRVKDGAPLDGEGIVLGNGFPSSLDVVYDGEAFSVVWSDSRGILLRRVDLQGTVLDAAPIVVSTAAAQQVTVAGSGDGGLLIGWPQPQPTVAYVRSGVVRNTATVGSAATGRQIEIGGSRTSFLVALAEPPLACLFDPCIHEEKPVAVQLVTSQGFPVGSPLLITPAMQAIVGEPVSHGGDWFVPILQPDGPRVVRVTGSATSTLGRVATIAGELRSAANGIEILGDQFRGLLSADPENVWYEPLPLKGGEIADGAMAQSETLLVDTGIRLVLRPLVSPALSADIAVVHVRRTGSGAQVTDTVRIEHRGGDDVAALHLEIWPSLAIVTSTRPIVGGPFVGGRTFTLGIEGPFKAGETIEFTVRGATPAPLETLVTVLPFAREIAAADNFLLIETEEPPPPAPSRRRLVTR